MVKFEYAGSDIRVYDYDSRELKTAFVDYGLSISISKILNYLGIDTGIVPKIS
jgi:hypothetical protein